MKQITIRGIPAEVEKKIRKKKEREGLSFNKTIVSLLEKAVGVKKKRVSRRSIHHDLDHLAEVWSKEEAKEFKNSLEDQRQIDEDIWK